MSYAPEYNGKRFPGSLAPQAPFTGISDSGANKAFFKALWVAGLAAYDEAAGIQWNWLNADGCMTNS
jgi:hypothetical protein